MSRNRLFRISSKREDSGVAEIVGAILLFAVVITLFTSFMVWYIPSQTSSNEVHYEQQSKSSMGSLISQLHSNVPTAGSTISQSISLGISGVSIFSSAQDTQFSILPSYSGFSSQLSFNATLNLTSALGSISTHYFNESYSVTGIMQSNGNTEYVTEINYVLEDGALFQNYGGSQPSNTLGPMPIGIVNSSGQYGLSLSIFGISGQSIAYSSTQAQVLNLLVNSSQYFNYVNGSTASLGGAQYTVNRITLQNLNYSINSSLSKAWNFGLYSEFNTSNPGYKTVAGLTSWNFTGAPLKTNIYGTLVSVVSTQAFNLSSISSEYVIINGQ